VISNTLHETRLLVLSDVEGTPGAGNARGHLFEIFVGNLMHAYGYEAPTTRSLNVTSDGIELDVSTQSRLDGKAALAECKAYSSPVKANELTNFYGKLTVERFSEPETLGLMVVIPRLVAEGAEKAAEIAANDKRFLYVPGDEIISRLKSERLLSESPRDVPHQSDPAVIVTSDGVYSATIELNASSRAPSRVLMWAADGAVPHSTMSRVSEHEYAQGLQVHDLRGAAQGSVPTESHPVEAHILATVQASKEDFQYQLPAAPKFFVGRHNVLLRLQDLLREGENTFVFNAQSGWGKSSLALKFADLARQKNGIAQVMDTRTASSPRYVLEVLQKIAADAEREGLLRLGRDASWASLASAIRTFETAKWSEPKRPILIFFDQFENVFRSEALTRSFRDLAIGVHELNVPLRVGFAWKTDLVGWTEGHPYYLRDEIRSNAALVVIEPFGSKEVTTLLDRLERRAEVKLVPDLRGRLREYSQGLPWLLKKLSDHVLREIRKGITQEQLLAEALNVQSLFETDMAELNPLQREVLGHVARYAPIPATEVTDRYPHDAVQSLVDRRLLVQIGDRLDTYWDIFRDFLNTGRVPVEDSYILRQTPNSVARLLPTVMAAGGSASVGSLAASLQTSDNVIFNLSRELRLLGVTSYEPLRVKVSDLIFHARDPEVAMRAQIANALRRHKAFSLLRNLEERTADGLSAEQFAKLLPGAFPAVSVKDGTWNSYARVFIGWFEYAGLLVRQGASWVVRPEGDAPVTQRMLSARSAMRARPGVPQESFGPCLVVLKTLARDGSLKLESEASGKRDAVRTLMSLGAVSVDGSGMVKLVYSQLMNGESIDAPSLLALLQAVPGGGAGIQALGDNPTIAPFSLGEIIRGDVKANWTASSTHSVGGYFRRWAKEAGISVGSVSRLGIKQSVSRRSKRRDGQEELTLMPAKLDPRSVRNGHGRG
jgi:hypothetical protein